MVRIALGRSLGTWYHIYDKLTEGEEEEEDRENSVPPGRDVCRPDTRIAGVRCNYDPAPGDPRDQGSCLLRSRINLRFDFIGLITSLFYHHIVIYQV